MRYNSAIFIPEHESEKHKELMDNDAKEKAIKDMIGIVKDGEYYIFRITKSKRKAICGYTPGYEVIYNYDINECERETIKIPITLEEQLFTPKKKFFARLWAGIRYTVGR
jgi:hypothetical protein